MTITPPADLIHATRLTRAGRLAEAVALLQRTLGRAAPAAAEAAARAPRPAAANRDAAVQRFAPPPGPAMPRAPHVPSGGNAPLPPGARFLDAVFSNGTGSRPYKLYVPGNRLSGQPLPLVVMLHGCTQSPDDFARGTRMNERAEEAGFLVAYPGQTAGANVQRCWNWFNAGNQRRGGGEPSLIAGIAQEVMRNHAVDARRVFVAGLSAGGAAAAIMGDAYPELFAAVGVHSGLACGAARDVNSAFAAMQGAAPASPIPASRPPRPAGRTVPAIVFHGDHDRTVNAGNADAVVAQFGGAEALRRRVEQGRVPGGHAWTRTLNTNAAGHTVTEQWVVHGAGHAWFGGSPAGSHTDPRGPDATREMVRFFLDHPLALGNPPAA